MCYFFVSLLIFNFDLIATIKALTCASVGVVSLIKQQTMGYMTWKKSNENKAIKNQA